MDDNLKLYDAEYRLARIVWDCEPLGSGRLAELCRQRLGWKRPTTYTVLRRLCAKGILQNENALVTARVKADQVEQYESRAVVERSFGGSLPGFITAFLRGGTVSPEEAAEIRQLIDAHREG